MPTFITTGPTDPRCDLDRELHLGRLTRALRTCVKRTDHNARRVAYARAGLTDVLTRDDVEAAALFRVLSAPLKGATA